MRELESVSSRSVVPPPQGFWGDVIGGYAAGALTNVAAGHLAAGMADAEYAAVAIADDLAFGVWSDSRCSPQGDPQGTRVLSRRACRSPSTI